jgi:hypothetical protein
MRGGRLVVTATALFGHQPARPSQESHSHGVQNGLDPGWQPVESPWLLFARHRPTTATKSFSDWLIQPLLHSEQTDLVRTACNTFIVRR